MDIGVGMGLLGLVLGFQGYLRSYVDRGGLFMRESGFAGWYQVLLCAFLEAYIICVFCVMTCVYIAWGVKVIGTCYNGIKKVKINRIE